MAPIQEAQVHLNSSVDIYVCYVFIFGLGWVGWVGADGPLFNAQFQFSHHFANASCFAITVHCHDR